MKTLYIECNMGAAGDMLTAALLELHPDPEDVIKRLNNAGIPNAEIVMRREKKCGIIGTHISVSIAGVEESEEIFAHHEHHEDHEHHEHHEHDHKHHHEHHHGHDHEHHSEHCHRSLSDIENIIDSLDIKDSVKKEALSVYRLIAEAEGKAHNCEIDNIHFHEVGTMDAVADIVGVCMLIDEISPDKIIASPVNTGKGQVRCAHGILPVPAPATEYILKDVPIYSNNIDGELCTPTGAALLKNFVSVFGNMPVMKINKTGYGLGTKDFEAANCVRAFIGETADMADKAVELMCNLDDMTGEGIAFAMNRLMDAGALDVFTIPIGMKKNRPGILLACICSENKKDEMVRLIFKHTTTIGIRENSLNRYILDRSEEIYPTQYGDVRVKTSKGYGVCKIKAEYDDLEKIALENDIDISDIKIK